LRDLKGLLGRKGVGLSFAAAIFGRCFYVYNWRCGRHCLRRCKVVIHTVEGAAHILEAGVGALGTGDHGVAHVVKTVIAFNTGVIVVTSCHRHVGKAFIDVSLRTR
jgi:hypothetical protein